MPSGKSWTRRHPRTLGERASFGVFFISWFVVYPPTHSLTHTHTNTLDIPDDRFLRRAKQQASQPPLESRGEPGRAQRACGGASVWWGERSEPPKRAQRAYRRWRGEN